eukprot:s1225_g13.t1
MLRLAGPWHERVQSKFIQRTDTGAYLCIPYGHGQTEYIPMKSQVTYLGARITYHNASRATVAHRIEASKNVFRRLRLWLSSKSKIPIDKRYQLWHATVFPTLIYGIFTVGLTSKGFSLVQMEIMRQLRLIAGDFSRITALSHHAFLCHRRWPSPATLLLRRVEGMIARNESRFLTLDSADIVLRHDWRHFQDRVLLLKQAMETDPTTQALHTALNPAEPHVCLFCPRTFATIRAMKLHMSMVHDYNHKNFRQINFASDTVGTLMAWLGEDAHRRMLWTCHCQTCGIRFTGVAQLTNHMQVAHTEIWHAATTCASFLSAYVHTIHRCVCNPSPGTVRPEHQCLILRQVAMQYVRARNAGNYPGLLMPYTITAAELSNLMPHAPADMCEQLCNTLSTPNMADFWTSSHVPLLSHRCLLCGHEAHGDLLVQHLSEKHSLTLNGAMMLQINLAALLLHHFQHHDISQLCPLCAATFAGDSVRQHLVTCPVLHQVAWALSKPCHGGA